MNLGTCPICRHYSYPERKIYQALPDQFDIPDTFVMHQCEACSFKFNVSDVTEEQLKKYYTSEYYRATRPYRDEEQRLIDVADRIENYVPKSQTIFEVGYEYGELAELLVSKGYQYVFGDKPDQFYDVIILNQVLEHVLKPVEFIDSLRKFCDLFYIDVPDGRMELQQNFEHVNRFCPSDLYRIFNRPISEGEYRWTSHQYVSVQTLWGFYPSYHKCYVRGFGHQAFQRIAYLQDHFDTKIVDVIDQDPRGLSFQGRPVLSPDDEIDEEIPILLCCDIDRSEYDGRLVFT